VPWRPAMVLGGMAQPAHATLTSLTVTLSDPDSFLVGAPADTFGHGRRDHPREGDFLRGMEQTSATRCRAAPTLRAAGNDYVPARPDTDEAARLRWSSRDVTIASSTVELVAARIASPMFVPFPAKSPSRG